MFNVNPGIMASIAGGGGTTNKLIDILTRLGLTGSLNVCLDAGDANSYDGTSQTWTDVSGNGNHYFRGSSGSVEAAADPVFVGTAGDLSSSTYFNITAATQYFQETSSSQTYADNWHKDNGAFTGLMIHFTTASAADRALWSDGPGVGLQGDAGINYQILGTTYRSNMFHSTSTTQRELIAGTTAAGTAGGWNFYGISFDEAALTARYRFNGTAETQTIAASTDTDPPQSVNRILIGSDAATDPPIVGDRIMMFAQWSRALTDSEMASIYTQLKLRIPSLP